jgi:hypothetical protein
MNELSNNIAYIEHTGTVRGMDTGGTEPARDYTFFCGNGNENH